MTYELWDPLAPEVSFPGEIEIQLLCLRMVCWQVFIIPFFSIAKQWLYELRTQKNRLLLADFLLFLQRELLERS